MLINSMSSSKDDQSIKIRFNSNGNKHQNSNGNGFGKSNGGFDYYATLLNKKRKLENDLKNGNMNNFNKVLNNAVMNSSRNNDNELIPNKIEFKLSHILKGERKIADNDNSNNLTDLNYYDGNYTANNNNDLKREISDLHYLSNNDSAKTTAISSGLEKKNSIGANNNNNNNINNSSSKFTKGCDSDNTSDLTKTSSVEDIKNSKNNNINNLNNISNFNNFINQNNPKPNPQIKQETNLPNELNQSRSASLKPLYESLLATSTSSQANKQSASRKNSCLSNNSENNKPSKQQQHKSQVFHDSYVDSLLEWKKPSHVGSGLNNMGNTCFLNSVLQSLLYTPGLINYFGFSEHKKKCNPKGVCLLCEFHFLVDLSKDKKFGSLTPKNILNNLKFISKNIKIGRQEDAHEFLLYLLDGLEKACKNFVASVKNNFIVSSNLNNEDNLIHKLFGGKLASCVICLKCKNVSKKVDQYLDISIDIHNSDSIHRSLKNFCKPESLSGSNKFYCESCKTKNDSLKKFSFENFPRVLVLHLKRFDNFQRKIKKFIEYPADLDLTNFSENKSEKYKYRLYGVLIHEGSTISWGHYYCFIKNSNELWYCMNDSHVSQTTQKNVLNQTPYLLFYERVPEKKLETTFDQNLLARKISGEISNFSNKNLIANNNNVKDNLAKGETFYKMNSKGLGSDIAKDAVTSLSDNIKRELKAHDMSRNVSENKLIQSDIDNKKNASDKAVDGDHFSFNKEKSLEKDNTLEGNSNNIDENQKLNKFEEKSKEALNEFNNNNKYEANINNNNQNILIMPQKSLEASSLSKTVDNPRSNINYLNKKSISDLKYNLNEYDNKPKQQETTCMGINEIKKKLLSRHVNSEKEKANQPTTLFNSEENKINNSKEKAKKEETNEVNLNLIKSKTSFEMKVNLRDEIDKKETSEIKNSLIDFTDSDHVSKRSSHKNPFMSRKFKRLMIILTKFRNTSKQANDSLLNKEELNKIKFDDAFNLNNNELTLELNESQTETTSKGKDSVKTYEKNINNKSSILNLDEQATNKNNQNSDLNTYQNKNDFNDNNNNNKNENELESEAPAKKRIFNTKINEIYHGRLIERWEDGEDDENELNKLRSQADFVRKSNAFKKQRLLRKSRYDMDYDAGKQKKVRIYDEKDSKGKNVFQQKHSTMLRKIQKGADPNTIIANQGLFFERKKKEKKFNHRSREGKFGNDKDRNYNNRGGKFNKFNKFGGDYKYGGKRFDRNNDRKGGKFKSYE